MTEKEKELIEALLRINHASAPEIAMVLVLGINQTADKNLRKWAQIVKRLSLTHPESEGITDNFNRYFVYTTHNTDEEYGDHPIDFTARVLALLYFHPDNEQEFINVETIGAFEPQHADERILKTQREFNFYEIINCFRRGSVNGKMNYDELNRGFELLVKFNDIELYDRLLEGCTLINWPGWPEKWIDEYKIAEDRDEFHRPAEIMNRLVLTAPEGTNIDSSFTKDNLLQFYIKHISLSISSTVSLINRDEPPSVFSYLHTTVFGYDEHYWQILSEQTPLSFFTNFSFLIHLMNIEIPDNNVYGRIYRMKYISQFMEDLNIPSFHFLLNFFKSPIAIKMRDYWKTEDSVMIHAVNINSYFKNFVSEELRSNLVFDAENSKFYDKRFKEIYDSINLVKKSGNLLYTLSSELRNNKRIVKAAVMQNGLSLQHASEALKADKTIVIAAVKQNGLSLKHASEALKADKTIVESAMNQDSMSLKYVSSSLKNNREFVLSILNINAMLLEFVSDELKYDAELVTIAIKQNFEAIKYISDTLKNNSSFMLGLILENKEALNHIGAELKNDKEFVLSLLNINAMLLEFASDELKNDAELATIAIKQNFEAIKYISDILKSNSSFMLEITQKNKQALNHIGAELRKDATFCVEVMKALNLKNIPNVFDGTLIENEEVKALIPAGNILATEYSGTVKFFSYFKGMGFIIEDNTKKEYYTDIKSIIDKLEKGDKVKFKLKKTDQGMSAIKVSVK